MSSYNSPARQLSQSSQTWTKSAFPLKLQFFPLIWKYSLAYQSPCTEKIENSQKIVQKQLNKILLLFSPKIEQPDYGSYWNIRFAKTMSFLKKDLEAFEQIPIFPWNQPVYLVNWHIFVIFQNTLFKAGCWRVEEG